MILPPPRKIDVHRCDRSFRRRVQREETARTRRDFLLRRLILAIRCCDTNPALICSTAASAPRPAARHHALIRSPSSAPGHAIASDDALTTIAGDRLRQVNPRPLRRRVRRAQRKSRADEPDEMLMMFTTALLVHRRPARRASRAGSVRSISIATAIPLATCR